MNKNEELLAGVKDLIDAGETAGLSLRLLGGLAVRLICPSSASAPFERNCSDADCVVAADSGAVQAFIRAHGWSPDAEFNLYNGDRRLLYTSSDGSKLDVFIKIFSMCHDFDFTRRIPAQGYTVYPADLVLTKLQIHEVNEKDLQDAACVFLDFDLADTDVGTVSGGQGINASYIAGLCSMDWGLQHSLVSNLEKTAAWAESAGLEAVDTAVIHDRIAGLVARIQGQGKSLAWRSRAIVGTKLRWYQEVEEVDR